MKPTARLLQHRRKSGIALADMIVSSAVIGLVAAALALGISTIQRTFRASSHHTKSQIEQARLIDYVSRDLRRALTVTVDTYEGGERLNLTIPDFYLPRAAGAPAPRTPGIAEQDYDIPRNPAIAGRTINYGTTPVAIKYYRRNSTIYRNYKGTEVPLATDVNDFRLDFTDSGQQSVQISITFVPKYNISGLNEATLRAATTASATVLLRNKRR